MSPGKRLSSAPSRGPTTNLQSGAADASGPASGVDQAIAFLLGVASGLQPVLLPLNLAIADAFIVYVMIVWVTNAPRLRGGVMAAFRACTPWMWMIAVGSVVGMFATARLGDSVLHLVRDFYAFAIFFAVLAWLVLKPYTWRPLLSGVLVVAGICAALTLLQGDVRPSGTFLNPNYAGHFLAMAILLLVATRSRTGRWWFLLLPLLFAGVLRTGSFGGVVMLAGGVCVLVWVGARRLPPGPRLVLRASLVAAVAFVALSGSTLAALEANESSDSGLSENRFERSSSGRLDRWQVGLQLAAEHPFGVGPGGAKYEDAALGDHELHNDPLAYLVERGALGLLGLLGFVVTLWRRMPPSGTARILLSIVMLGSLVRETLNYRHVWIVLALALAFDWQRAAALREGHRALQEDRDS